MYRQLSSFVSRTHQIHRAANMSQPVLIIGSGLGGLTLAHSLKKHNIPYRIFERDSAQDQRAQGYRIGIDSGGAGGLQYALTPELFEEFEKTCPEWHRPGGRVDGPSGKVLQAGILAVSYTHLTLPTKRIV